MSEILVVTSKVKKIVAVAGLRTGQDYITALSTKVESIIKSSVDKVKAEGKRKTLGGEDIIA